MYGLRENRDGAHSVIMSSFSLLNESEFCCHFGGLIKLYGGGQDMNICLHWHTQTGSGLLILPEPFYGQARRKQL